MAPPACRGLDHAHVRPTGRASAPAIFSPMRKLLLLVLLALAPGLALAADAKPLKALLITGGGFHDYDAQTKTLTEGISARANVEWTVVLEGKTREHRNSVYEKADWANGFDVIVHNECYGMVADPEFVQRIAAAHKAGVPAVILHATVHSYRNVAGDAWREVVGVKSMSHEGRRDLIVKRVPGMSHPVMKGFPETWTSPQDECYKVDQIWPGVTQLATVYGEETKKDHLVIWLNTQDKMRVFGTTLGHLDGTMKMPVYLDLVTRGLLWSVGKLNNDGTPAKGYAPGGK